MYQGLEVDLQEFFWSEGTLVPHPSYARNALVMSAFATGCLLYQGLKVDLQEYLRQYSETNILSD